MKTTRGRGLVTPLALLFVGVSCSSGEPGSGRRVLASTELAVTGCKVDDDCGEQPCCGGVCVDPATDANNCGGCGVKCATGASCTAGTCVCPSTEIACSGKCTDLKKDPANCGGCGVACGTGGACEAGVCTCPDTAPSRCGATCTSTETDADNCGACGIKCPNGKSCIAGECDCPVVKDMCDGACVDTRTDPNNCGGCKTKCKDDYKCVNSECTCPGLTCANDVCVKDPDSDASNCGGCGIACGPGQVCSKGKCAAAPPGTYSAAFTAGVLPTAQCAQWNTFRAGLTGTYASITLSGTYLPLPGLTCTGAAATRLCNALRTGTSTSEVCAARAWHVGGFPTVGVRLLVGPEAPACAPRAANLVVPCVTSVDFPTFGFGGLGGTTCTSPSQTMTVECK